MDSRAATDTDDIAPGAALEQARSRFFNRELSWLTLARDLPEWCDSLTPLFRRAAKSLQAGVSRL